MDYKYKDCSFHVTHSLERKVIVIYPSDESRSPELSMTLDEVKELMKNIQQQIFLLEMIGNQ